MYLREREIEKDNHFVVHKIKKNDKTSIDRYEVKRQNFIFVSDEFLDYQTKMSYEQYKDDVSLLDTMKSVRESPKALV